MRLGTYWLVRVGVVMLLTAMVFFGRYAYQNFIAPLGPTGKVLMMYLAGGLLLGLGAWLQRARESLRNYGQVVFAGGLAAVYFTTYAAHHLEALRVISSPLLDGVLLLGWTAYLVWLADRRKSELLALFGIGLAFYSSAITQVGMFTLYSNLLLTTAAVWFLVRNRWATLSFVSLAATYAGYAFWRFHQAGEWRWAGPDEGLWSGVIFLMCYWAVFTVAVFLSTDRSFEGGKRQLFLTANNVAFFALFLLTLLQVRSGGFWRFCFIYGGVLLGAAVVAQDRRRDEPWTGYAYLIQGLVVVALGCFAKFTGPKLGLILAAESVVLLTLGDHLKHPVLRSSAAVAAVLAMFATLAGMERDDWTGMLLGSGAGGLLLFNAWWCGGQRVEPAASVTRPAPTGFAFLALVVGFVTTWIYVDPLYRPAVFAVESLILSLSIYLLRVPEVVLLGQGFLLAGQILWLADAFAPGVASPAWAAPVIIALSLAQTHWWQRQRQVPIESSVVRGVELLYSLPTLAVLFLWLEPKCAPQTWLMVTALLAVAVTAYGVLSRSWMLAATGQLFAVASTVLFARQLVEGHPHWGAPLVPWIVLGSLSASVHAWLGRNPNAGGEARPALLIASTAYRWVALVMAFAWVEEYVPAPERTWVLVALGSIVFGFALWRPSLEAQAAASVLTLGGLVHFWIQAADPGSVHWPDLLAILAIAVHQQIARRHAATRLLPEGWHAAAVLVAGLSVWRFVGLCVLTWSPGGFYVTASWAMLAFAVFTAGLGLAERTWRWLGLAILGAALGRVVLLDVWRLDTLYRMISFFALGVVLLALGFLYNRFQDRIRQLL